MGVVRLTDLSTRDVNFDEAAEIGTTPVGNRLTAMWVGRRSEADPTIVYKREIEPIFIRPVPREMESGNVRHHWLRFEIQIPRGALPTNLVIHTPHTRGVQTQCVVSAHPYSTAWHAVSTFKSSWRKATSSLVPDDLDCLPKVFAYLESLHHDYWETGNYLTAGLNNMRRWEDTRRNLPHDAVWVLGMCTDADVLARTLAESERAQQLIRLSEKDVIHYQKKGVPRVPLHQEVIDACREHLILAIRQSLAGPHKDSERWYDRDVLDKVEHIFCSHLNAHNRRLRKTKP